MGLAARTGAWAKSGSPTPAAYGGLRFTAEADNSTVQLTAVGSAPAVTLVKSFDGVNWEDYTVGEVIELPSIGDFVYLAAGEGGNNAFGASASAYHKLVIKGLVASSGDITSILNFDCAQTTLAKYCYVFMFDGCTGLTSAPELPATTLASASYSHMFEGCTNLSLIKVYFIAWKGGSTTGWLKNVSPTGTFYKPSALPDEFSTDRIPTGWTVVNID